MAKGFKDSSGKFHPTGNNGTSSMSKTVTPEGIKIARLSDQDVFSDFTLDLRIKQLEDEVGRRNALEETGVPNSDIAEIENMLMLAIEEKESRVANPQTQSQLGEHIVQVINENLLPSDLTFPYGTHNIHDIQINGKKSTFKVIMQSHDDETVREIENAGFKVIDIDDIIDTRHATIEADIDHH